MDAALIILDGWGIGKANPWPDDGSPTASTLGRTPRDAVFAADTPNFDRYTASGATGRVRTAGRSVGLPAGQAGNSEVGHLTIGAGRVVPQPYTRIEDAIAEDRILDHEALADAFDYVDRTGGRLHLFGLLSDGGVHADHRHIHALVTAAADRGLEVVTHPFTDGRDTSPTAGVDFMHSLTQVVEGAGTGSPATVMGRYYAMDRDGNWERTKRAYDAIVEHVASHQAPTGPAAVEAAYERGETDEFIEPTVIADRPGLQDGDAVIFCNFRADRARQLTRMLVGIDPEWPHDLSRPDVYVATMTEYDEEYDLPVAFRPRTPGTTLGSTVAAAGLTQLRIAESEKYAHVTYFLNGGREAAFAGEQREIVPSPDVSTYDLQPAMHAEILTDRALDHLAQIAPSLLVLNYANADMVGHTGDYEAAIAAVEAVDDAIGRLVPALRSVGAHVLLTADHGNADNMGTPEHPHTAHTFNPVPLIYLAPHGDIETPQGAAGDRIVSWSPDDLPGLSRLAPTVLALLDLEVPDAMTEPILSSRSDA